jgi:hypothetical protein
MQRYWQRSTAQGRFAVSHLAMQVLFHNAMVLCCADFCTVPCCAVLCCVVLCHVRLLPAVDVLSALQRDPDLVTSVMCNRNLSIW